MIAAHGLPWIVKRLGCRVEYWFRPDPPRNGGEAAATVDADLDRFMHLAALNRGIMLTPFREWLRICMGAASHRGLGGAGPAVPGWAGGPCLLQPASQGEHAVVRAATVAVPL